MKNIFSKIKQISLGFSLAIVLAFGFTTVASAQWNSMSNDCQHTLAVTNYTQSGQASVACWPSNSATLGDGDILNFNIYYHNTGSTNKNLTMRITPDPRVASADTTRVFTVIFYEGGSEVHRGTATVNLPANAKLKLQSTRIVDQGAYHAFPGITLSASDDRVFTSGVTINNLVPNEWKYQGAVRVAMSVSAGTTGPTGKAPVVNTQSATNVTTNSATLNGDVVTGDLSTDVWFDFFSGSNCTQNGVSLVGQNVAMRDSGFSKQVNNLAPGTYSYRAYAQNSASGSPVAASQCRSFTIAGTTPIDPPVVNISLTTNPPTSVSSNGSATLNGFYNINTPGRVMYELYSDRGYSRTFRDEARYVTNSSDNFPFDVSGLPDGYYTYRIYFVADNGTQTRGQDRNFTISRGVSSCSNGATNPSSGCNQCLSGYTYQNGSCVWVQQPVQPTYVAPTAQTLNPVTVNAYQTTLGGYYTTGSCAGSTWFEYGPTQSLGSRTSSIARSANSVGNTSQTIYGLSPNTTYYYRVVSQNCQNTAYASEIRSFTTTRPSIVDNITRIVTPRQTTTTTQVVSTATTNTNTARTTVVGGTGVKYLRLNIDNDRKELSRGDGVTYEVQWENISDTITLNNLVLEVTMPKELQIVSSSRGDIDRSANAVYLNIDRLDPREEGRMTLTTRMNGSLRSGDPVVGRAIMAFENPTLEGAQENAIAYDSDRYEASNSTLGASAFGAGFLPGTLAGWLIILLIIVLIILAARHYMRSGYYNDDRDHGGPYTPYRPQN